MPVVLLVNVLYVCIRNSTGQAHADFLDRSSVIVRRWENKNEMKG